MKTIVSQDIAATVTQYYEIDVPESVLNDVDALNEYIGDNHQSLDFVREEVTPDNHQGTMEFTVAEEE